MSVNFFQIRKSDLLKIGKGVHQFFFLEIDPFILGIFRILLGVYLIFFYFMLSPSWLEYYGPFGISPNRVESFSPFRLIDSILFYTPSNGVMWVFYAASMLSAFCLALGVLGKIPILWLWISNIALFARITDVSIGEEQVLAMLLFFSLLLPLSSTLRVSDLFRKSKRAKRKKIKVTVWALRPLQIQFALIYLLSVPHKFISDPEWLGGTVVYYATMQLSYPRWPGLDLFVWGNALISRIGTYFTLLIEAVFPVAVWFRRLQVPITLVMISFHIFIGIILEGLLMFNVAMILGLILYLPSRQTKDWFAKLFFAIKFF